jgi:hypothetical protein
LVQDRNEACTTTLWQVNQQLIPGALLHHTL